MIPASAPLFIFFVNHQPVGVGHKMEVFEHFCRPAPLYPAMPRTQPGPAPFPRSDEETLPAK